MDLTALHSLIRETLKDGKSQVLCSSGAERAAVRAWRERLGQRPGSIPRIKMCVESSQWMSPPPLRVADD